MNSLIEEYNKDLDKFEYKNATRNLIDFIVDNISREYIQFVRNRNDGAVPYVLKEALLTSIKLLAPTCPFVTDKIYLNLKNKLKLKKDSIHLEEWPKADKKSINKKLEEGMENVREVLQNILSQREKNQIGVRWPLRKVTIQTKDLKVIEALEIYEDLILRQTNIKEMELEEKKVAGRFELKIETKMDEELLAEGYSREIMRRIQDLRKQAKLKKEDRIELAIKDSERVLDKFKKDIKAKVGAVKLEIGSSINGSYKFKDSFKIKEKHFEIALNKR